MCLAQQQNRHAPRCSHQPGPKDAGEGQYWIHALIGHAKPAALFTMFTFRVALVPKETSRPRLPKSPTLGYMTSQTPCMRKAKSTKQKNRSRVSETSTPGSQHLTRRKHQTAQSLANLAPTLRRCSDIARAAAASLLFPSSPQAHLCPCCLRHPLNAFSHGLQRC